jgi:hypothetical protein
LRDECSHPAPNSFASCGHRSENPRDAPVLWASLCYWLESEATQLGIALKSGKITSDELDAKLAEMGALDLVYPELMGTP